MRAQQSQGVHRNEAPESVGSESKTRQGGKKQPAGGKCDRPCGRVALSGAGDSPPRIFSKKGGSDKHEEACVAEKHHIPMPEGVHHPRDPCGMQSEMPPSSTFAPKCGAERDGGELVDCAACRGDEETQHPG